MAENKIEIFGTDGNRVGEILLPEKVEKIKISPSFLHEVVTAYLSNQRAGTASTKTRGEVSGGGKKPWRQKHTGRARHGSIRSPLWRKGGVVFGPKPKSWRIDIPSKKIKKAVKMAIKSKIDSGQLLVLQEIKISSKKTKEVKKILDTFKVNGEKVLMITKNLDENLKLAGRNIENLKILPFNSINTYEILRANKVFITEECFKEIWK
ncbi:MAG: 50S ribosomal protein L4 [Endomicrobiia bacterium]